VGFGGGDTVALKGDGTGGATKIGERTERSVGVDDGRDIGGGGVDARRPARGAARAWRKRGRKRIGDSTLSAL